MVTISHIFHVISKQTSLQNVLHASINFLCKTTLTILSSKGNNINIPPNINVSYIKYNKLPIIFIMSNIMFVIYNHLKTYIFK